MKFSILFVLLLNYLIASDLFKLILDQWPNARLDISTIVRGAIDSTQSAKEFLADIILRSFFQANPADYLRINISEAVERGNGHFNILINLPISRPPFMIF
jgi:hypothetical protein